MRKILVLLLALISAPAFAQVGQLAPGTVMGNGGSSQGLASGTDVASVLTQWGVPLPGTVGGTNSAFMQFSGPASTLKTYTLPNASDTIATLTAAQTFTNKTISGGSITGLPTPTASSDAATKAYVDANASGLTVLPPSRLATAAILPNSPTYANGTSGVGATLTAGANSTLTVDGTVANLNDVVLVQTEASAFRNGIYTVTTAGSVSVPWVLTRASYFDQATTEMKAGSYTQITAGSTNINKSYVLAATITTVGTDAVNFNLFSSASSNLTVGSTAVANGTTTRVLFDNAGTLGEYVISGTGSVVMSTSPTITTPSLANPTTTGTLTTTAATTGAAGSNFPHGTAPTVPSNGDFWSTTAGFFGRVNGATVGPFGPSASCPVTTITVNTTLTSAFCQTVLVDATSGAVTVTLFAAGSGTNGNTVNVKKVDTSLNNVTVAAPSGNIDGFPSVSTSTPYGVIKVQPNNSQWWQL